ncbi:MAG: hypothetical protein ACFUZC_07570 [Chthoniobacteraceae bacterium]
MSLRDEKAADLAGLLNEVGELVTWNGRTYKALVSDPAIGEHLDLGGFTGTGEFTIKIPRASFDKRLPKLGELVEFEGDRFRIERITNHPQYPLLVIVVGPLD